MLEDGFTYFCEFQGLEAKKFSTKTKELHLAITENCKQMNGTHAANVLMISLNGQKKWFDCKTKPLKHLINCML